MNILISGPCGIGKTTTVNRLSKKLRISKVNFDKLGIEYFKNHKLEISPFSHKGLNLRKCFEIIQDNNSEKYILDIGGDNIFHKNGNNENYLSDLLSIKNDYSILIFILSANEEIVESRFIKTRSKFTLSQDNFKKIWAEWEEIIRPYWEKCSDHFIDTSYQSISQTCQIIEKYLTEE